MDDLARDLARRFAALSTPLVADGCLRTGAACRHVPGVLPLIPGTAVAGRALPVRHFGSVDVFLEAFEAARAGDVLAIDNGGRTDEGCIGDLTALEARAAGVAAIAVWGCVRDVPELQRIGLPVWTAGRCPLGPAGARERTGPALGAASFGRVEVTGDDVLFADDDGVVLVAASAVPRALDAAEEIAARERRQAEAVRSGNTLRRQLAFAEYLERRRADPAYTFRKHLEGVGGAIEV